MKYNFDEIIDRRNTDSVKWGYNFIENEYGDKDLLPLWIADMDFVCAKPILEALEKRVMHGIFGYSQAGEAFYKAVIDWNKKRHGLEVDRDWIVFVPGIVPAIKYAIETFTEAGDKIVVQNPVFEPFSRAIKNGGCEVVHNRLKCDDGFYTMDYDDLREKTRDPKVKLMILCSPHNPVGRVWNKEELEKAGAICLENGVIMLVDEIHSDIIMKGYRHVPFVGVAEEIAQNAIVCVSPSKTFNLAGMQAGNLIIKNETLRVAYQEMLDKNSVGWTNPFAITSLIAAYSEGEEWFSQVMDYLEGNVDFMESFINERMPEVGFRRPQGTYLAWLDFARFVKTNGELEDLMRKGAGVALDEGHLFGPGGEGFVRVNFACPRLVLEECLVRMERAIR